MIALYPKLDDSNANMGDTVEFISRGKFRNTHGLGVVTKIYANGVIELESENLKYKSKEYKVVNKND